MQAHNTEGFKIALGYPKGDFVEEIFSLLHGLATDAGHENISAWVKSPDFDPDDLTDEHGASYRRTKYKGKYYHNYEWTKDLKSKGEFLNEYRVGLVLVTKTARGDVEFAQFSARKWWGSRDG